MDLFTINRYEESKVDKNPEKENDILANLLKKAEKRKRKSESKPTKNEEIPDKIEVDEEVLEAVKEEILETVPESRDLEGFQVLGQDGFERKKKVEMVLPPWLAHPTIIETKIKKDEGEEEDEPLDSINFLSDGIKESLKTMEIKHLFPVQKSVIPWLLDVYEKPGLFRPRDICVSAPTGSGKTLAFAIPIIQMLSERVERKVRALIVLPVAELALQVFKVFKKLAENTSLSVIMFSTTFPFHLEQEKIVEEYKGKFYSLADIIVTTPGRLVEHIHSTKGFSLKNLKFLVIDEADKIMDQVHHNWLYHLDTHVKDTTDMLLSGKVAPLCLNELKKNLQVGKPPHKLLFSATLSQDPEKLQNLRLFQPKLFTSVIGSFEEYLANLEKAANGESKDETTGEFVGKYTTPAELTEKYCLTEVRYKPLTLFSLIEENKWTKFLVFTNSADSAHRLSFVLQSMFAKSSTTIAELSATLKPKTRTEILTDFSKGKISGLICSDALARGIDIPDVDIVVSYDPARHITTYIHRIGRTARAGRLGTAIALVTESEHKQMNKILNDVGKNFLGEMTLSGEVDDTQAKRYSSALDKLRMHLEDQQRVKTMQKQLLKTKIPAKKSQEPMSLMEKLQVDVQDKMVVSTEKELNENEAQLSKTAKKKLGLIEKKRKRKAKGEQKE
ncbi:DDX51 family protein [Megaselia abdita]